MKQTFIIFLLLVTLMPFAQADLCTEIISKSGVEVGKKVPSYIPYGNEVMNVYGPENKSKGHVIIEKHTIKSVGCSLVEKPTYKVYINNNDTVNEIFDADDPMKELNKKLGDEIKLEGKNILKNIKTGFAKMVLNVVSWFR